MNTLEAIRIALQSLWANKLRSVLTLLGVVIGVSAVIAVVTFVAGINGYVANKVFGLGADVFIIGKMPGVVTDIDTYLEGQRRKDLTMDDYRAVAEGCQQCSFVGASITNQSGHARYENQASIGHDGPRHDRFDDDDLRRRDRGRTRDQRKRRGEFVACGGDWAGHSGKADGRQHRSAGEVHPYRRPEYRVIGMGKKEGQDPWPEPR